MRKKPRARTDLMCLLDSLALAGFRRKMLVELVLDALPGVGIGGRRALARDVRPLDREVGVQVEALSGLAVRVGDDGCGRAVRLAHAAYVLFVGGDTPV